MSRITSIPEKSWPKGTVRAASEKHHVYVVQEGEDGPCKIGCARNALWRLYDLQCGNPRTLFLRAVWGTPDRSVSLTVEANAHRHFIEKSISGEWFNANPQEIVGFINQWADQ